MSLAPGSFTLRPPISTFDDNHYDGKENKFVPIHEIIIPGTTDNLQDRPRRDCSIKMEFGGVHQLQLDWKAAFLRSEIIVHEQKRQLSILQAKNQRLRSQLSELQAKLYEEQQRNVQLIIKRCNSINESADSSQRSIAGSAALDTNYANNFPNDSKDLCFPSSVDKRRLTPQACGGIPTSESLSAVSNLRKRKHSNKPSFDTPAALKRTRGRMEEA
jgi:hypothetical protein